MTVARRFRASFVFLIVLPLAGCLFRSHPVPRQISNAPLKTATQADLLAYINSQASKVHSMEATVDIDTTVGGEKKGKITDYQEIRGYVLARKPAMLRMIGLMPLVRTRAFDMVSDGQHFKLWIPPKNRFIEGQNQIETPNPKQPLENLRPQHIYDALLLRAVDVDPTKEIAVMESAEETITDAKGHQHIEPDYEILVIRNGDHGWYLSRKIVFSRVDLLPHRQLVYDQSGNLETDAHYEGYKDYNGINFPSQIEIKRPQEEYDITLTIVKLQLNEQLTNDQFQLARPPGSEVIHLDQPQAAMRAGDGK